MKKAPKTKRKPDLLPEYDFNHGRPNKYAKRYAEGTNLVLLAPDVAPFFPDSAAVNDACGLWSRSSKSEAKNRGREHSLPFSKKDQAVFLLAGQ
jgi:hypothetical protein